MLLHRLMLLGMATHNGLLYKVESQSDRTSWLYEISSAADDDDDSFATTNTKCNVKSKRLNIVFFYYAIYYLLRKYILKTKWFEKWIFISKFTAIVIRINIKFQPVTCHNVFFFFFFFLRYIRIITNLLETNQSKEKKKRKKT